MRTSGVPNTEPNPEAVSHTDEKSMAGTLMDAAQTSANTVGQASIVSAEPESKSGDCDDALMRCYNR